MPQIYEVEHEGKVYEVEADSPEQAAAAFAPAQSPQAAPQSPQGAAAQPNPQFGQLKVSDLQSYGSGLVEGLRRTVAGGKQLAGAVSDYFTRLDKAGRGHKDKFTAQEMLRAATASAEAEQAGLDPALRETAAVASQAGTLAVAPELALPRATTVVGALGKNFLSGGIGGAFTFEPDEDLQTEGIQGSKLGDTLGGAASSSVIGLLPSLPPAIKNVVGRGLARISNEGRTAARVAQAQAALPNTTFSLAQRTGVPELIYLERRAYDFDQVNFFADQTDQFIADAARALRQPLKPGQTLAADGAIVKEAMDDHISNIRKNASKTFNYGLSKAVSTAAPDTTIPIDNFRRTILEIVDTAKADARVLPEPPLKPEYIAHLEELAKKPAISVKEVADSLREMTALQSSNNKIAVAYATKLRNEGLNADLDAVEQLPIQRTDDAVKMLLATRAEYRRSMNAASAISDAAIYKLLDGATEPKDMIGRFASYSPSKQANIRDFMAKHSPDLLRSLKQGVIDDAVARSGVIREAADSQKSLDELQSALFDGDVMRTSGLWNPLELKRIEGIKDGLRVIKNTRPNVGTAGTPVAPEDVAINLVSRSGPFMARFITRALTSSRASDFFIDPNIYQQMTRLNRSTTGTATNLAARATLMAYLQENYPADQQETQ